MRLLLGPTSAFDNHAPAKLCFVLWRVRANSWSAGGRASAQEPPVAAIIVRRIRLEGNYKTFSVQLHDREDDT